jgi:hypothetical protein
MHFLNSKFGKIQMDRFIKGIGQPDLHLEDIANKNAENSSTLLKEDSIIDETILNPEIKQFSEKLLDESKVEQDIEFAEVKEPTLLDQQNIVNESILDEIETNIPDPKILKEDNIVEEQIFENMSDTLSNSELLKENNIIDDQTLDNKANESDMMDENNIKDDQ